MSGLVCRYCLKVLLGSAAINARGLYKLTDCTMGHTASKLSPSVTPSVAPSGRVPPPQNVVRYHSRSQRAGSCPRAGSSAAAHARDHSSLNESRDAR